MIKLSEEYLRNIINEEINKILNEAGGTLTSKVIAGQDAPRRYFNADEVLKRALSCNSLKEIYDDKNLYQMLRYHKMSDGRSYLDYVKEQFAKEGKYMTNKRGGHYGRNSMVSWTPESAIEYSSNYVNGYELTRTPEGRSCYYYLKKNGLLDRAFKKARKADAEKANKMLVNREEALQKQRQEKEAMKAKKIADMEAAKKQKEIDKEHFRLDKIANRELERNNKIQQIIQYVKDNGLRRRAELKKANPNYYNILQNIPGMLEKIFGNRENSSRINDMNRLNAALSASDSPSYFRRYSPLAYKRMMDNGTLQQYYPGWEQVNGIWRKK